jgi:hypothetical protein
MEFGLGAEEDEDDMVLVLRKRCNEGERAGVRGI